MTSLSISSSTVLSTPASSFTLRDTFTLRTISKAANPFSERRLYRCRLIPVIPKNLKPQATRGTVETAAEVTNGLATRMNRAAELRRAFLQKVRHSFPEVGAPETCHHLHNREVEGLGQSLEHPRIYLPLDYTRGAGADGGC